MTFNTKEIIKFLFPEWQVIEEIKRNGFIVIPKKNKNVSHNAKVSQMHNLGQLTEESNNSNISQAPQKNVINKANSSPQGNTAAYQYKNIVKYDNSNISEIFNAIRGELGSAIIGQSDYLDNLCVAFKRPFVMGHDKIKPKNIMLLIGNRGTGKHYSISLMANAMKQKKLISSNTVQTIDLSLYPTVSEFSLFLSDLYKCLYGQSAMVVFDNFDKCHSNMIDVISTLSLTGKYTLISRYIFQNNNLVEATGMLLQNSISEISSNGKYFIFISEKDEKRFNEIFGTKFMESVGDIVYADNFSNEDLIKLSYRIMETVKSKCSQNLSLLINYDNTVSALIASNFKSITGTIGLEDFTNANIYKPLAEYKLKNAIKTNQNVFISANNGDFIAQFEGKKINLSEVIHKKIDSGIEDVKKELENIIGIESVKQYVLSLEDNLKIQKARENAGYKTADISMHMIFTGNPGTGKTTIARIIAKYLKALGVLSTGQLREVTRADLVGQYVGHTAKQTNDVIKSALGGVLFIDEAYALCRNKHDTFGLEAIDTLVKGMEDNRNDLVVILAGYKDEMADFLNVNSGLKSRFPNIINFEDYTSDEMYRIALITAQNKGYRISEDCKDELIKLFDKKQIKDRNDSGNGRLVRNVIEKAILNQSKRLLEDNSKEMDLLKCEDFKFEKTEKFDLESELSKIIGLDEVKDYIRSLSARLRMQNERKKLGLAIDSTQTLHMIFKGNPGTGKTMVARTVAQVLYNIGVINTNKLVETDRAGLVAGYVGQTAIKTREKVMEAMDGVLFIDEAYSLSQGGSNDFGKEAIDTLVKLMDDYRDRIVVILAGYSKDMDQFLSVNPGLKSRFPNIIEFPDYTTEQLIQISELFFKGKGYEIESRAKIKLEAILSEARKDAQFGNGRYVRNVFEKAVNNQALRLSNDVHLTKEQLITITDDDIERV